MKTWNVGNREAGLIFWTVRASTATKARNIAEPGFDVWRETANLAAA